MSNFGRSFGGGGQFNGIGNYANPHQTIGMRDVPTQLKQVMRLCRFYYNQDALLGAIVDKMAEYPITPLLITEKDGHTLSSTARERWDSLLNTVINIRQVMLDINVDKFVYGNSFHYLYYPFVRYCVCKTTGERTPIGAFDDIRVNPTDKNGKFGLEATGKDPRTGETKEYDIEDHKSEARSGLRMVRLSPLRMELEYNPVTGARRWYWVPPARLRDGLSENDRTIIDTTEMAVLEAVFKEKRIHMNDDRLWVSQAACQPDLWEGWGIPPLFRVLEDVYYYKVLRRANESLAQEHVTPMRILSPAGTGDVSPQRSMNLADWQNKLKRELQRFKSDPNHIMVSPVPINIEQMGGQARVMMVASEIEAAARVIAAGVGCPVEMIWGGLNWSGASVSLRVLENHFINMREDSMRLLDFAIPKISTYFRMPLVNCELTEFKMADDVQQQGNAINLMLQGFLDRESVLGEMGFDPDEVFSKLEGEHKRLNKITMQDNVAAAHMNTVIQSIEAKGQVLMEMEMQLQQTHLQAQNERERLSQLSAHVNSMKERGYATPLEFEQSASLLQRIDPQLANLIFEKWSQTMPNVTSLLMSKMNLSQMGADRAENALAGAAGAQSFGAAEGAGMEAGAAGPYAEGGGGGGGEMAGAETSEPLPEQRPPQRGPDGGVM